MSAHPRWRRRAAVAAGVACLGAGGGYAAWSATHRPPPPDGELLASADRQLDPVIVPRRRRPQVVEPVAGEVGSAPAPPEEPPPPGSLPPGDEERPPRIPGAPSDAEVRRELARLEAASRRYRFDELDFSGQLVPFDALPSDGWRASVASVFYDYGHGLACGGLLRPEQLGVAHKTAPCGTLVTFRFGGRAIRVPVIDRGPYIVGREWDFTGATAAALGFPGLGAVEWHV